MMFETSSHGASLTDQTMAAACGYHQQISSLSSQNHGAQSLLNLLQYSHHENKNNNISDNPGNEVSSKVDDEYEFLWDMNIEEHSLGNHHHHHGVASNLDDDMRFEIDNSMVFL
ncbi:hypothetical protein CCACVL1_02584 [Corchorus capsularis]|uniref:Uncharacterized protein n=1 Tax=Corchorus capsularis TaxID=210143 RepID=A0A1R3K7I8_COCAP|nr:hypothetical protein CCACVL1_02584 [Corchorus capsularis]